jgi:hypothetical protein
MSENEIPNLLAKRFDIKSLTIGTFFAIIEDLKNRNVEGISPNTKVICYTNFGTISGRLLPGTDEEADNGFSMFHEKVMKIRNKDINLYESEGTTEVLNDTGHIPLVDVEIHYYANPNRIDKLSYFLLYPDQVVGLTFGERREE